MASMLCLSTSNLVARSFRSTVVSASRCLSIHAGRRDYTTMPAKDDSYEQSWPRMLSPKISSMSSQVDISAEWRNLEVYTPESEDGDTYKGLRLNLYMPGLKQEDLRACAQHKLPYMTSSEINKDDIKKDDIMANLMCKLIASIRDITMDTFYNRPVLGKGLCPLIARPLLPNSFSVCMTETYKNLETEVNVHGTIKLTTQGLCVSFYTNGVKRKDVKTFFVNNTLFIEVKREHRLACIYIPERTRKKHNMIKRQMKDDVFCAIVACSVKKEEVKDQLKCITN